MPNWHSLGAAPLFSLVKAYPFTLPKSLRSTYTLTLGVLLFSSLFLPSLLFSSFTLESKSSQNQRILEEEEGEEQKEQTIMSNDSFLNYHLSKKTSIFGLRLWVIIGICVGAAIVLVLFLISLWFTSRRSSNNRKEKAINETKTNQNPTIPNISKEIQEIRIDYPPRNTMNHSTLDPKPLPESEPVLLLTQEEEEESHIEAGKEDRRIGYLELVGGSGHGSGEANNRSDDQAAVPEVSHLGWGHWYTLRELEDSTNGFADENVIGEGGYGIVYRGTLDDNTQVAIKNLLNNRY